MTQTAAPPRSWVWFGLERHAPEGGSRTRLDRYRVETTTRVSGAPFDALEPGARLTRIESSAPFPPTSGPLVAVTQHLVYTHARERRELVAASAPESGPVAVLIPIKKSDVWWAMAQDERDVFFRPTPSSTGHIPIGMEYAQRIHRRLYHARYAGGGEWDFLTYFEFPAERAGDFRTLLRALRDPDLNPEWSYVERETEIWLTKLGP
jgi:chlorite dismutase